MLVGPGRWGSADPWLGIPVQWSDISGVAAIIELRNDTIKADASQGTHFFQNITSLGIPYLTLNENNMNGEDGVQDYFDWNWLKAQPVGEKGAFVHHIQLDTSFILKCDGTKSESVLFQAGNQCNTTCTVNGREVWDQNSIQTPHKGVLSSVPPRGG